MLLHAQRDHRSLINNMDDRVSHFGGSIPGDARLDRDDRLVMTKPRLRAATVPVLNNRRTGHARFRRGPIVAAQQQQNPQPPPPHLPSGDAADTTPCGALSASASSSLRLTAGGEGSVSGGAFRARSSPFAASSTGSDTRRPPVRSAGPDCAPGRLEASRQCHGRARSENDAGGGRCHCSKKRRMSRAKKVIIRVPAMIGSRTNADIPPDDDSSWRKYGQKPIKGSPYPRGYYKCSTVRGCPARKHVERDPDEPAMLIVTYEGDHRHDQLGNAAAAAAVAPA